MKHLQAIWAKASLKKKLFGTCSALVFATVILTSVFIFSIFGTNLKKQILHATRQNFTQTSEYLDYKFQNTIESLNSVCSSDSLSRILSADTSRMDIKESYWNLLDIKKELLRFNQSDNIDQIRLYTKGDSFYSSDKEYIFSAAEELDAPWLKKLLHSDEDSIMYSDADIEKPGSLSSITIAGKIKSTENYNTPVAYLRIDIKKDLIKSILKKADTINESLTFLLDADDVVVAASHAHDQTLIDSDYTAIRSKYLGDEDEGFERRTIDGKSYLVIERYLTNARWCMVTMIPYSAFIRPILHIQLICLLGSGLVLLLIWYIIKRIANSITGRVDNLIGHMRQIESGKTDVYVGDCGEDEIGALYHNFDYMIRKVNRLMDEKYEYGKKVKDAELQALQSQINPHFLYNTLDMIKWFSYSGRNEEIESVVTLLSRFYKLTLNHGNEMQSLRDEIAHVTAYIEIQKLRFDNRIAFDVRLPDELLNFTLPKMTLQPLIENCILHGIMETEEQEGTITLTGSQKGADLALSLSDDGIGMNADTLRAVREGTHISGGGSSYGIKNIDRRLKMLYGRDAGLFFSSTLHVGTTVTIRIKTQIADAIETETAE